MALRGKKRQVPIQEPADREKEIEKFINQGGSSIGEVKSFTEDDPIKNVQLRIYQSMIAEIDELLEKRPPRQKISRHQWIIDAIEEKKEREQNKLN